MNEKNYKVVDYEFLASEYYDVIKHPTCANFRDASKLIISNFFAQYQCVGCDNILEIGAGKSLVIELMNELELNFKTVYITDKSDQMLQYSKSLSRGENVNFKCVDAQNTGFDDGCFNLIISSLGDPYNTYELWIEIKRLLKEGGLFLFTTPAYDWSNSFRNNPMNHSFAEFLTTKNEYVKVPSLVYPIYEQKKNIEKVGLKVKEIFDITLNEIKSDNISSKLKVDESTVKSILTGYLVEK